MNDRTIRSFIIEENTISVFAALLHRGEPGRNSLVVRLRGNRLPIRNINPEKVLCEILIGTIVPHISRFTILQLENRNRNVAEGMRNSIVIIICDYAEVEEVHFSDAFIVIGLFRIFIFNQSAAFVHCPDGVERYGPAVVIALQL